VLCRFVDTPRSKRRRAALIAALALVAVLAAAPTALARKVPFRGVAVHSLWAEFSDRDMDRELNLSRAANATVVRVDVAWGSLEVRGKGQISQWYLRRMDRFINGAARRRMKVIVTLWSSPCWASSAPGYLKRGCTQDWNQDTVVYPPSNPADFGDIAHYVTKRYGTKLAALEVWNEPNLSIPMFWKTGDPVGAYAALVRATYARAKSGNRKVPIVAGALVRPDIGFLRALYAAGIKGYYDGISIHPYGTELTRKKLNAFHAAQRAAGDKSRLWITEFGAPTSGGGWHVSERGQAAIIRSGFTTLGRMRYVRGATLYALRDTGNDRGNFIQNFGVLRFNFKPKAGWAALRRALR
jgi:hypothetical protein